MNPARPPFGKKNIQVLGGQSNGKLDTRVLATSSVRGLKLNVVSVRKFNALQARAIREGIALSSTGDYRTFQRQVDGLHERADRGFIPGRDWYRFWDGTWWSGKPGTAGVATPGTSNHGTGRSRDFAEMVKGHVVSLTTKAKQWLARVAPEYGIYFEVTSEDWHGTDYDGDVISAAVLAEESGTTGPPIPGFDPEHGQFSLFPLDPNKAPLYLKIPAFESDLVAYLQGVLRVVGLAIAVDDQFGPQTDFFVREFQKQRGLFVDGKVGPVTWKEVDKTALGVAQGPPAFDPEHFLWSTYPTQAKAAVKLNSAGDLVKYLQGRLKYKGASILVDGKFGPRTDDAVRWFQGSHGLKVDGLVGDKTWAVIDK